MVARPVRPDGIIIVRAKTKTKTKTILDMAGTFESREG
ncbi:hypothetical protein BH11PSE13_BH11PSE13_21780 [soil metagenome]